jgi:DNA-binding MurR/RpiR family transcriptional regulator
VTRQGARRAAAHDPPGDRLGEGEVRRRLRTMLPTLSRKRMLLAQAILDEPFTVAVATAADLGAQLGVDPATVVRFSRSLGYAGYAELKEAIRSDLPHMLTVTEKLRRRLLEPPRDADAGSVEGTMSQDIRNIQAAAAMNGEELVRDAAAVIASSDKVVVLASGMSAPVADVLAHLLDLAAVPARFRADPVLAATDVAGLGESSAVVAIGFWRYVSPTVRLFEVATRRTRRSIAITDSHTAPLARLARFTLPAPTDATAINNSLAAPIAVVNALITAVTTLTSRRAYALSQALDEVYESGRLTISGTARLGEEGAGGGDGDGRDDEERHQ